MRVCEGRTNNLKFIKIRVGYEYKTSRDGTCAIRTPVYSIEYEDENGDVRSGFYSNDLGYISTALIKHFGIRSVTEEEE